MTHGINSTSHSGSKKQVLTLVYCLSVTDAEKLDPSSPKFWYEFENEHQTRWPLTASFHQHPPVNVVCGLLGRTVCRRDLPKHECRSCDPGATVWESGRTPHKSVFESGHLSISAACSDVTHTHTHTHTHTSVRASATGLPGGAAVFMWEEGSKLCFTLSDGSLDGAIKNETSRNQFFVFFSVETVALQLRGCQFATLLTSGLNISLGLYSGDWCLTFTATLLALIPTANLSHRSIFHFQESVCSQETSDIIQIHIGNSSLAGVHTETKTERIFSFTAFCEQKLLCERVGSAVRGQQTCHVF